MIHQCIMLNGRKEDRYRPLCWPQIKIRLISKDPSRKTTFWTMQKHWWIFFLWKVNRINREIFLWVTNWRTLFPWVKESDKWFLPSLWSSRDSFLRNGPLGGATVVVDVCERICREQSGGGRQLGFASQAAAVPVRWVAILPAAFPLWPKYTY